jgi:hypothetical protein
MFFVRGVKPTSFVLRTDEENAGIGGILKQTLTFFRLYYRYAFGC